MSRDEDIMAEQKKVLVVDDEEIIRDLLTSFLCLNRLLVETAVNGQMAIERLSTQDYDLVITDIEMPRVSGIELIQWIRHNRPDTPVIILSGIGPDIPPELIGLPIKGVLEKGVSLEQLEEMIRKVLRYGL